MYKRHVFVLLAIALVGMLLCDAVSPGSPLTTQKAVDVAAARGGNFDELMSVTVNWQATTEDIQDAVWASSRIWSLILCKSLTHEEMRAFDGVSIDMLHVSHGRFDEAYLARLFGGLKVACIAIGPDDPLTALNVIRKTRQVNCVSIARRDIDDALLAQLADVELSRASFLKCRWKQKPQEEANKGLGAMTSLTLSAMAVEEELAKRMVNTPNLKYVTLHEVDLSDDAKSILESHGFRQLVVKQMSEEGRKAMVEFEKLIRNR